MVWNSQPRLQVELNQMEKFGQALLKLSFSAQSFLLIFTEQCSSG